MKILGIILTVLLVIIALLGIGLQMFLTSGLTTALNQHVFPAVKSMYGLDMSITNASVNLFKGTAELDGLVVRNLKGYEEPYLLTFDKCLLDVEMMSLLKRDPIVISLAEAEGATVIVERNQDRNFNIKELADALKPAESPTSPGSQQQPVPPQTQPPAPQQPSPPASPAEKQAEPIPIHIRRIAADTAVKYVDSKLDREYSLNLRLTGSDIFTVPAEDQPNSLFVLRGSLADDEQAFATDLNAIVEPLTDPQNPTFNATGSILDINADFLRDLLRKNDMEVDSFSVKPSVVCTKGRLEGSQIDLIFNNLKIYDTEIGETTLKLPLTGTLQRPVLDLTHAVQSFFSEQSLNIGKAIGLHELRKQLGVRTNAAPREILIGGLTNNVKEITESPELQQLIKQVIPDGLQSTNSVKKDTDSESVKESLKSLGTSLFGK
jgi:hypothetical protein